MVGGVGGDFSQHKLKGVRLANYPQLTKVDARDQLASKSAWTFNVSAYSVGAQAPEVQGKCCQM